MKRTPTTMRLSEDAKRILAVIARKHGLNSTRAFELIVREAAEKRGISTEQTSEKANNAAQDVHKK